MAHAIDDVLLNVYSDVMNHLGLFGIVKSLFDSKFDSKDTQIALID